MKKVLTGLLWAIVIVYLGVFLWKNTVFVIPPQEVGAVVTLGNVNPQPKEGMVFKMPFISTVKTANAQQKTVEYTSNNLKAKTQQKIGLTCTVIYQINRENFPKMYKEVNMETYEKTLLYPKIESSLQQTIGKEDALLLATQPEMVRAAARYILADELSTDGFFQVKDVLFSSPKYDSAFEEMIEKKLTEEQKLEYAKIQTQVVEEEARQALAKAMVDVETAERLSRVLNNPLIVKYEAVKALQSWDGKLNLSTLMLGGQNGVLPIVPTTSNK